MTRYLYVKRTTVIGMLGAFGKTKDVSSNLPLLLQFSASHILRQSDLSTVSFCQKAR